jgi:hypothetical protein
MISVSKMEDSPIFPWDKVRNKEPKMPFSTVPKEDTG